MSLIAGLLNGTNKNYDHQITALAKALLTSSCVVRGAGVGLAVTTNQVATGEAFIQCTRTNGQKVMVHFENTENYTINTSGTKKVYVVIDQAKLDDGSANSVDGSGIASIGTDASYPSGNYVPLASISGGVITDERVFDDTNLFNLDALLQEIKGADLASDSTVDLSKATGNTVHITGTTTITSFGTAKAGLTIKVVFDGALTLTHHATSLILPGVASITTSAGDTAIMFSEGSGNWRCLSYQKANGQAVVSSSSPDADEETKGVVERDTDAEALLFADIERFINARQLGLAGRVPEQNIPYSPGAVTQNVTNMHFCSSTDGSVAFLVRPNASSTQAVIYRLVREDSSGQYIITHTAIFNPVSGVDNPFVVTAGDYLYFGYSDGGTKKMQRYAKADLSGVTAMTISGTSWSTGKDAFSDGTDLYIFTTTDQWRKYTISGTTITHVSAITYTSAGDGNSGGSTCDGMNVYIVGAQANATVIRKYALAGGAVVSSTTRYIYYDAYATSTFSAIRLFIPKIGVLGLAYAHALYHDTAMIGCQLKLITTAKP